MREFIIFILFFSCSHKERPLQERQLIQCYLESDTYTVKKPFDASMAINVSELGTVTSAKVTQASEKDPNLNACLSYVMMGAGRPLQSSEAGPSVRNLRFKPDGKHEL